MVAHVADRDAPTDRRRALALAVFRTLDRLGIERASLREIARDAGVTTGSLTHHFADRRALLEYALGLAIEEPTDRLVAVARTRGLVDALAEYLPLDERRRLEGAAWLVSIAAARRDPALAASLARRHAAAHELITGVIKDRLRRRGGGGPGVGEADLMVEEVLTGTDGIVVYALADPERYPPARQLELVRRLLERVGLGAELDRPPA
jgi:AcrR family transcriptional regulator